MAATVKAVKRIHSVTIRRMVDESPDTSHLGEYTDRPGKRYTIDRAHAEDCIVNTGQVDDETLCRHCNEPKNRHDGFGTANYVLMCAADDEKDSDNEFEPVECSECGECVGDGWSNREYRYFESSGNYDGETPEDVRKYTWQDYRRMEAAQREDWFMMGVRAEAEVALTESARGGTYTQTLTSGGLWGIESDSDDDYIAEVEREELADLRRQLEAAGFSKRAVTAAFRNVERKDS